MADSVTLNELYTLQEVYNIEFGVRGYWKCQFDNAPDPYKQKAMIAKSCNEADYNVSYDDHKIGLISIYTPSVLQMPTLNITFYDDNENTITKWLRAWKLEMRDNDTKLQFIEDYAYNVYCSQYSPQHKLIEQRDYLVAPGGKIMIANDENVSQATVQMEFQVFKFNY